MANGFDYLEFATCARYGDLEEMKENIRASFEETNAATLRSIFTYKVPPSNSTALHMASANNHIDIVKYLLEHLTNGDVNLQNDDGATALHWASLNGHKQVVSLLLKAGADATIKNNAGRSSLTMSEQQGHLEVSQLLLDSFEPDADSIQETDEDVSVDDVESGVKDMKVSSDDTIADSTSEDVGR
ncbi:hypothetical protein SmJEL517_g01492 [Synchytrium microbalum]|uniref:protein S-acyltransferase n=1 Tax=Synchytrium microbalum TaxID=1806994 RepID=A0A507C5D2_9FUNG|nr:uncharacterized protein SmJEL517_g01492 [Synchytrium microbalum]TPX36197.1 hypothetical protein SmJEL517_g01492 [Synchytrium microbalum]